MVDVVAIADEGEDHAVEPAEPLAEREDVGEPLARMFSQRQPVDDRDRRLSRELDDDRVRAGPGDDRIDEPLEVPGDVADALPGAHHDVLGQVDRVAAELVHAGLERHPGAKARALEQHRERPPDERRRRVPPRREELRLELRRRSKTRRTSSRLRSATDRRSRPFNDAGSLATFMRHSSGHAHARDPSSVPSISNDCRDPHTHAR